MPLETCLWKISVCVCVFVYALFPQDISPKMKFQRTYVFFILISISRLFFPKNGAIQTPIRNIWGPALKYYGYWLNEKEYPLAVFNFIFRDHQWGWESFQTVFSHWISSNVNCYSYPSPAFSIGPFPYRFL